MVLLMARSSGAMGRETSANVRGRLSLDGKPAIHAPETARRSRATRKKEVGATPLPELKQDYESVARTPPAHQGDQPKAGGLDAKILWPCKRFHRQAAYVKP